ncbi:hypothetical protein FKW77_002200 [Venturia effusa]|uniref:SIS domain-containing protein n=1 Tax=Venturia effusa TaxID=50376 RepID=A0A517L8T8_9PEZI|nr:hypothetical protein FKW77_002200 [Venturia effusa]
MTFVSTQLETMAIPALPISPDMEALDAPREEHMRPCKRKRSELPLPLTPPATVDDPEGARLLERAVYILSTEATALSYVTRLYQTDPTARNGLLKAVECIARVTEAGGKLLVCGVGKSGYIGQKIVATMKSLGIASSWLHAAEAIHGDLGDIRPVRLHPLAHTFPVVYRRSSGCILTLYGIKQNDALLFITFSGKTPELMNVSSHVPHNIPIIALTSHMDAAACLLLADRPDAILLPAPIHESEESTFGVSAPTTSTTVAIAVGDMLALTTADRIHQDEAGAVFRKNHPGGAIGMMKR